MEYAPNHNQAVAAERAAALLVLRVPGLRTRGGSVGVTSTSSPSRLKHVQRSRASCECLGLPSSNSSVPRRDLCYRNYSPVRMSPYQANIPSIPASRNPRERATVRKLWLHSRHVKPYNLDNASALRNRCEPLRQSPGSNARQLPTFADQVSGLVEGPRFTNFKNKRQGGEVLSRMHSMLRHSRVGPPVQHRARPHMFCAFSSISANVAVGWKRSDSRLQLRAAYGILG